MKTFCSLAFWLLLSVGQVVAQRDQANDKSKLIALENAWNQAQIHRDGNALSSLVADTFIYTDWDGTVMNKARFIADAKDSSTEIISAANDEVEVYFYPGVAIVAGAYHTKGVSKRQALRSSWKIHGHVDIFQNRLEVCGESHQSDQEITHHALGICPDGCWPS